MAKSSRKSKQHPSAQKPHTKDTDSIASIIAALYDVISGPKGRKRDWDRLRSLFLPEARLIPPRRTAAGLPAVLGVEGYIVRTGEWFESTGFFEAQITARTEAFGNIAHVFSTYVARRDPKDPEPFSRGINSIQLLFEDDRWWVVTILWDVEREDNPLPVQYLP